MSERTGIEWTEATWNPWYGCTKVSPGCAHCYMFREQRQYGRNPEVVTRSKTKFSDPLKWAEPRLVFTCSWSDWFHEAADQWRPEAWDIVRRTPHLTYQVLTKRPHRIRYHLPDDWGAGYPNVWLGVSIESQRWAGRGVALLGVPAALRFVSAEPLLAPLDLTNVRVGLSGHNVVHAIDWLIAGGESGPEARPTEVEWLRSLRDQCDSNGTAFFLKQLGGWPDKRGGEQALLDGQRHVDMPASAVVRA